MIMQEGISLQPYNTFGLPGKARRFARIQSVADLIALQPELQEPHFILGGGSNILLTGDLDRLVLKMD